MCWFWNLKQLHAQNQGSDSFFELESSFLSYTWLMTACLKMCGNRSCCYLSLMVQSQRYDMKGSCEWHEDGLHNCYVLKYASVMITARGVGVMRYLRLKMSNSSYKTTSWIEKGKWVAVFFWSFSYEEGHMKVFPIAAVRCVSWELIFYGFVFEEVYLMQTDNCMCAFTIATADPIEHGVADFSVQNCQKSKIVKDEKEATYLAKSTSKAS